MLEDLPQRVWIGRPRDPVIGAAWAGRISPFVDNQFAMIIVKDPQFKPSLRAGEEHIRLSKDFRSLPTEISGSGMSRFEVYQLGFKFDVCRHDISRRASQ